MSNTTTTITQVEKVARYLRAGRTLTAREAQARFSIKNLRARVSELRAAGMQIGTIPYTRKDGVNAVKYVLEVAPQKSARSRTRAR
jgi:L-lactate utilization protein LutB